jgi:hypothetical protein
MINKQWTGKNAEGSGRGLVWNIIPAYALTDREETTKNLLEQPIFGPIFYPTDARAL